MKVARGVGVLVWFLLLLPFGAHPRGQTPNLGAELLAATGREDVAAVGALLAKGVDVDTADPFRGVTPLYIAAERGSLEMVKTLLPYGPDLNVRDLEFGRTPLRHTTIPAQDPKQRQARDAIRKLLVEKGAGAQGESLVDLIRAGDISAAQTIIGRGSVDPAYLNLALAAAKRGGHTDLIDVLTKAGAKDPGPTDALDSPARLRLLTGVYRSEAGHELTLGSGLHEDQLLLARPGQPRIALLPLDLIMLRSLDRKVVVTRSPGPLPPRALHLRDGDRTEVFTRAGDVAASSGLPPSIRRNLIRSNDDLLGRTP
jgi:hypothetical protein